MSIIVPEHSEILLDRELLIIDDHQHIRLLVKRILQQVFHTISEADNLEDATKALDKLSPNGVIVSDLQLNSGQMENEGLFLAQIKCKKTCR